jgi:hypothetical protein
VNPLAGLVVEAWKDVDRVVDGVSAQDAVANVEGQSSIAWTLGHVTEHADRLLNFTVQGHDRHPLLGADRFCMGSEGVAEEWDAILQATKEVREAAMPLLEKITDEDLDVKHDFPGAVTQALGGPLTLRYGLIRIGAHHYFHIGVIACQRDLRGESVGDYPGLLESCV